jgi:phosphohistidine phosphatase
VPLLLDVLRHGEAESAGPGGDASRALSPAGRRAMTELAASLMTEGWRADRIFSSPLLRARQTAEIVREGTSAAPGIDQLDELLAEGEPAEVLAALRAHHAVTGHVLLVTHQPLAGRLAGLLTVEEPGFSPGTLVRIECATGLGPGRGRVIHVIEPKTARL